MVYNFTAMPILNTAIQYIVFTTISPHTIPNNNALDCSPLNFFCKTETVDAGAPPFLRCCRGAKVNLFLTLLNPDHKFVLICYLEPAAYLLPHY